MAAQHPCLPFVRRKGRVSEEGKLESDDFSDIQNISAMDYLSKVVEQARRLPDVCVSDKKNSLSRKPSCTLGKRNREENDDRKDPIQGSAASLSYLLSGRTAVLPPPSIHHLPRSPRKWVDATLETFSRLRLHMELNHRKRLLDQKASERRHRLPVPSMKDRPSWHIFCVGSAEARGNEGSYFDDGEQDEDGDDDDTTTGQGDGCEGTKKPRICNSNILQANDEAEGKEKDIDQENAWEIDLPPSGYAPTVRLLLQFDQVLVRRLLSHLAYYLEEGWSYPLSEQRAAWIYGLLLRLERPIHRDDAAVLWSLLKRLCVMRADIPTNDLIILTTARKVSKQRTQARQKLSRLNLLIALIGIYFEQGGGFDRVMTVK